MSLQELQTKLKTIKNLQWEKELNNVSYKDQKVTRLQALQMQSEK